MTDPITQQPFNPLAYVPALALALGLAAGWATLRSDITTQDLRLQALADNFNSRVATAATREADQEGRIRSLEVSQSRTDEKFSAIMDALGRLETRLEDEDHRP